MNYYHIWANPQHGVDPKDFALKMRKFLDHLVVKEKMSSYKVTRMKLGFRSIDLPEFHVVMEFENMQQLDDAMTAIIDNEQNVESLHVAFNQLVDGDSMHHALYRDYPDE